MAANFDKKKQVIVTLSDDKQQKDKDSTNNSYLESPLPLMQFGHSPREDDFILKSQGSARSNFFNRIKQSIPSNATTNLVGHNVVNGPMKSPRQDANLINKNLKIFQSVQDSNIRLKNSGESYYNNSNFQNIDGESNVGNPLKDNNYNRLIKNKDNLYKMNGEISQNFGIKDTELMGINNERSPLKNKPINNINLGGIITSNATDKNTDATDHSPIQVNLNTNNFGFIGNSNTVNGPTENISNNNGDNNDLILRSETLNPANLAWKIKLKKYYIYGLTNIIYIILIAISIVLAFKSEHEEYNILASFQQKFQSMKLITDIYIISAFDICDQPYEKPIFGRFPGYNQGCICNKNNTYQEYKGSCEQNNLYNGSDIYSNEINCMDINPVNGFYIKKWNNEIFCMRRTIHNIIAYFQYINYYASSSSTSDKILIGGCNDPHKKKCIISNNGNFICVDKYEFCPLTNILITANDAKIFNNMTISNWTTHQNLSNSKILLGKAQDSYTTAILNLTIHYENCSNLDDSLFLKSLVNNDNNAKLSMNANNGPLTICENTSSLELIDIINYSTLLQQNSPTNDIDISQLNSVLHNRYNDIGLYSIKADLLEYCEFDEYFNPYILSQVMEQYYEICEYSFYNIISILALLFLNLVRAMIIMHLNNQKSENIITKEYIKNILFVAGILIQYSYVYITFKFLICIFAGSWTFKILLPSKDIVENWDNLSCKDNGLQMDINKLAFNFNALYMCNLILIITMILLAMMEFALRNIMIIDNIDNIERLDNETDNQRQSDSQKDINHEDQNIEQTYIFGHFYIKKNLIKIEHFFICNSIDIIFDLEYVEISLLPIDFDDL